MKYFRSNNFLLFSEDYWILFNLQKRGQIYRTKIRRDLNSLENWSIDNRDCSDPIAIGDVQPNYHRFEFERFNSQQRITRTTPERERERRSIIKIESRREKVRSQKLDKKFLFISLEIICNDEIVKSSCSVYRDSRYRVIE